MAKGRCASASADYPVPTAICRDVNDMRTGPMLRRGFSEQTDRQRGDQGGDGDRHPRSRRRGERAIRWSSPTQAMAPGCRTTRATSPMAGTSAVPYDIGAGNALLDGRLRTLLRPCRGCAGIAHFPTAAIPGSVTRGSEETSIRGCRAHCRPKRGCPTTNIPQPAGPAAGLLRFYPFRRRPVAGRMPRHRIQLGYPFRRTTQRRLYLLRAQVAQDPAGGASYAQWFKTIRDYLPSSSCRQIPRSCSAQRNGATQGLS